MEDNMIIDLYWARNEQAIEESKRKYDRALTKISYNILNSPEDSEECVSDTYVKAWNAIPPDKPFSLFAYLGRITRNISINLWHKNHAEKRNGAGDVLLSELEECIPSNNSTEQTVEVNELSRIISDWLFSLSKRDRLLFIRRYWYGDSIDDLSKSFAQSKSAVSGRLFRMRNKLKLKLEKEGISI